MTVDNPQKRPGTSFIRGSQDTDKGSPQNDPLSGENRATQTTTHYPFTKAQKKDVDKGSGPIEGQKLRGYAFNDSRGIPGGVEDATVAPDGTRRVKDAG